MNWTGKAVFGILLLFIGANIFLKTIGIDLGGILGLVIAGLLMVYGYGKMKSENGSSFWGMIVFIFGLLLAIGHVHIFGGILIAAAIIYFGYKLIVGDKGKDIFEKETTSSSFSENTNSKHDAFDDEWEKFLTKNHLKS